MNGIGKKNISGSWRWSKKLTIIGSREKLDKYVTMRGEIAHRGKGLKPIKKTDVTDYFDFIKKLSAKTGGEVNRHVKKITGKPLWR